MNTNLSMKVAVIGPTQCGKTCLAVGLFATSTSGFTIETVDQDGRAYLDDLKAEFAKGAWPEATNRGTKKEIRFDFLKKGKTPIRVEFPEFSGERLGTDEDFIDFANEHFRELAGVVLLLNPGATAFQSGDPSLLADAMTQYKRVLSFLRNPNNRSNNAFVALTVTASDRLEGDLKGKLEAFNQSVEELSNTLETSGIRWKRFNVTVTGNLEEQQTPKLAKGLQNSASAPFLWLLDQLNWLPIRISIIRKICYAAGTVAAIAAFAGIWCAVDAKNAYDEILKLEAEFRGAIAECESRPNPAEGDLEAVRAALAKLRTRTGWFSEHAAKSANDFEPAAWNAHDKRIRRESSTIAEKPEEYGGDCDRVDKIFNAFTPKVQSVVDQYIEAKKRWDADKPKYQDAFAVAQMLETIRQPLEEKAGLHGNEVFNFFSGLYGKLTAAKPIQLKSIALKEELSQMLDARVEKEWREFAIPDFDKAAKNRASHEATRAFVVRLSDWNPLTTNGIAAKTELLSFVTNSVPEWRSTYETTTFLDKMESAVKSGDMASLAALYPQRVATNDFLTAEFVCELWTNRCEAAFGAVRKRYLDDILAAVEQRRGRPRLTKEDRDSIDAMSRSVGAPFDADSAKDELEKVIAEKAIAWEAVKREECDEWVKDNVRADRKRTGQNSLWDEYETFMRENHEDNPFAEARVRTAVYRQVENWFESDIRKFGQLKFGDGYSDAANAAFEPFKLLCRRVSEDKTPQKSSWAWHFARDCVDRGRLDSISSCFPQCLTFTKVEGKIDYGDFRVGYKGTDLSAGVVLLPLEVVLNIRGWLNVKDLMSSPSSFHVKQTLEKDENRKWISMAFDSKGITFHPFDIVSISLEANDRINVGRNLECKVKAVHYSGIQLGGKNWSGGVEVGGEFDLRDATVFVGKGEWWQGQLTTRDPTPDAFVRLYGTVSGDSIYDFQAKAKTAAEREQAREK